MSTLRTINAMELVYGTEFPEQELVDDPAEAYHEASKLYRSRALRQTDAYLIESNPNALVSTLRSTKRIKHLPSVALPEADFPDVSLGTIIKRRRSVTKFASQPIALQDLATVLFATYGVTLRRMVQNGTMEQLLRAAPSGGGLYPLDIYVAIHRVDGLQPGIYYYDSLDNRLVLVNDMHPTTVLAEACIYPDTVTTSAATLLISAAFWRSRFKYRLRAYRITVLEAGHVAQNALLAANALGLGALPLGGFFEADIDRLLNNDGVNEGVIYSVALGAL